MFAFRVHFLDATAVKRIYSVLSPFPQLRSGVGKNRTHEVSEASFTIDKAETLEEGLCRGKINEIAALTK